VEFCAGYLCQHFHARGDVGVCQGDLLSICFLADLSKFFLFYLSYEVVCAPVSIVFSNNHSGLGEIRGVTLRAWSKVFPPLVCIPFDPNGSVNIFNFIGTTME